MSQICKLIFRRYVPGKDSILRTQILIHQQIRSKVNNKHYDMKWKKLRAAKVLKMDLPDFQELRRDANRSMEETKADMKRKGLKPPRSFNDKKLIISNTGGIFESYVPPEGDGVASFLSKEKAHQAIKGIETKGKSYVHARKVRKFDPDFDSVNFSQIAQEIYMTTQYLLQDYKKNSEKLHSLVTEHAYSKMTWHLNKSTMRWRFIESLEHPRVVHIRTTQLLRKEQLFAQVTVRMHTKQILALFDRFGRLTYGSEYAVRDCLEYVVMEKYLSDEYGQWRVHDKIIPDWMTKKEGLLRTKVQPSDISEVKIDNDKLKPRATEDSDENKDYVTT